MPSKKITNSRTKARTTRTTKAPDRKSEVDSQQPCSSKDVPSQQATSSKKISNSRTKARTTRTSKAPDRKSEVDSQLPCSSKEVPSQQATSSKKIANSKTKARTTRTSKAAGKLDFDSPCSSKDIPSQQATSSKKITNSKTTRTTRTTKAPDRKSEVDSQQPCCSKDISSQQAEKVASTSSDDSQASTPSNVERNTATNSFVGSKSRRPDSRQTSFARSAIKRSVEKAEQHCDEHADKESSDRSKQKVETKKYYGRMPTVVLRPPLKIRTTNSVNVYQHRVTVKSIITIKSADEVSNENYILSEIMDLNMTQRHGDRHNEHMTQFVDVSEDGVVITRETIMNRSNLDALQEEANELSGFANICNGVIRPNGKRKKGLLGMAMECGLKIDHDKYVSRDKLVFDIYKGEFDYEAMCKDLKNIPRSRSDWKTLEHCKLYEAVRVIDSRIIVDRETMVNLSGKDRWWEESTGLLWEERTYDYELRDQNDFLALHTAPVKSESKSSLNSPSSSSSRSKSKRSRTATYNEATKPYEEDKVTPKKHLKTTDTKRSDRPAPKASSECLSQTLNDTTESGPLRTAETKHSDNAIDTAILATINGSAKASKHPGETPIFGGATPQTATTKQSSARKDVTQSAKKGGTSGDKTAKSTSMSKQSLSSKKQTSNKKNSAKSASKTSNAAASQTMEELEARAKIKPTESGPRPSARRNLFGMDENGKKDELANLGETFSQKSTETSAKRSGSVKKSPKHGNDSVKETKPSKKAAKELNSTSTSKKKSVQTTRKSDAKTPSKNNAPVTDMNVSASSAAQLYADSHNNDAVAGPSRNGSLFKNRSTSSNEAKLSMSSSKKKNKTSGIGLTYDDCSSSDLSTPSGSGKKNTLDLAEKIVIPSSASKRNSLNKSQPQPRASPPKSNGKSVNAEWADRFQKLAERKPNVTKNETIPHNKLDDDEDTEVDQTLPVVSKSTEVDISSGSKQDAQHTTTKIVQVSALVNGRKVVLSSPYRFKHHNEKLNFVTTEVKFRDP